MRALLPNEGLPAEAPVNWAAELQALQEKVSNVSSPCLNENDAKMMWRLAQQVISANPEISSQLTLFWNFRGELDGLESSQEAKEPAPQWNLDALRAKIEHADSLAEKLVSAAKTSPLASLNSLLLAHVIKTNAAEHPILRRLERAVAKHEKLKKYDSAIMCSIRFKVSKYEPKLKEYVWKSDVKAICDAIVHAHFSVTNNGFEDVVEFSNNERGYHFKENFTLTEFHRFFDLHTSLYRSQLLLLYIFELLPLLTQLVKKTAPVGVKIVIT